ncbi:unnamed protein product [Cuscuta campestris]|uniref:Uncharacterized protein n=1 Tax=Cuscuta campestris TaxID=132261 RepID=A0A484MZ08_9ASTE|nr:unnamed protein product [Cuscuta campestris]
MTGIFDGSRDGKLKQTLLTRKASFRHQPSPITLGRSFLLLLTTLIPARIHLRYLRLNTPQLSLGPELTRHRH